MKNALLIQLVSYNYNICMYVCEHTLILLYTLNALIPQAITYPPTPQDADGS